MPYRLKATESSAEARQRIIGGQCDYILNALPEKAHADSRRNDVHKARKHCKKIRAVLKLFRRELGDAYRPANARFREAARLLAPTRDADAMLDTLERLQKQDNAPAATGIEAVIA